MKIKMITASLGLALLSTPALAAGGACNGCVEHEQMLKAGPVDGYLRNLRDEYKPLIILVDRSTNPPTVQIRVAFGGVCACGGPRGDRGIAPSGGGTRGRGESIFGAPTGRDILGAIAAGFGGGPDVIGGIGPSEGGADIGRSVDTSTGNTGLSGGERNANGDSLGIGN